MVVYIGVVNWVGGGISCIRERSGRSSFEGSTLPLGHTDIAPTIVAEQLAEKYPEALFIHTTRPRDEWAHALVRFVSEQPRKCLFTTHPTPRKFYDAAYGDGWSSYTVDNWKSIHNDHENRMQSLRDKVGGHRFLKIDITSLGKRGEDKKG